MFRNFVKPAVFERVDTREQNGDCEHVADQANQTSDAKDAVCQPLSNTLVNKRVGHSAPKDVKTLQPKIQNKVSLNTKTQHSTSIYVNGTNSKQKSSVSVPVTQRQSYHQQSEDKQTEGLSQHKQLPNSKPRPASSSRPDVQKRRSIPDVNYIKNVENKYPSNDVNSNVHIQSENISSHSQSPHETWTSAIRNRRDSSDSTGCQGSPSVPNRPDEQDPAGIHRRALYSQTKYNIVPPPPPLVGSVFAGRRDIRHPDSVHEKQIVSVKGTVRGFKNRVRAGIATFWAQSGDKRNYRQLEQGKIVVYATSMSVVRETDERCKGVRRLLQNHMVRYEERDLYMTREIQQELRQRLSSEGISSIHLPHVFADGIHIGGADELEKLNEAGELRGLLDNYQKVIVRIMCNKCGGYRFLPCEFCHGSKKSLLRNHFTEEFCALRCMHCDENGLRRCDMCADQQE